MSLTTSEIHNLLQGLFISLQLQSNLHKTTTFGTTKKWSPWIDVRLTKHLYKMITKQIWSFLAGF